MRILCTIFCEFKISNSNKEIGSSCHMQNAQRIYIWEATGAALDKEYSQRICHTLD